MIDELMKAAPKKLGMRTPEEAKKIILELVAKWEGTTESSDTKEGTITNKENSSIHQFSAQMNELVKTVQSLQAKNEQEVKRHEETERQAIIALSAKDEKIIPLSTESMNAMPVNLLKELVEKLPKGKVPTKSMATKTFSADSAHAGLKGLDLTKNLFQEQADAILASIS